MAAAKPSRSAKPAAKAAAAKASKPAAKAKPAAAKPAAKAKPATTPKPAGLSADQQAKAKAATVRRIHSEQSSKERAKHEEALAERFERSRKVAEMHHAKVLGYQAGRAAAMGLTIEQYQQHQAEQQAQKAAAQNQAMAQLRQQQGRG